MGLRGKLESCVEVMALAHMVHHIYSCETHKIANLVPDKVQGVKLQHGRWGTAGSIIVWNITHDGVAATVTELIEAVDLKNCTTTYKVIGGDILERYKTFKFFLKVIPKEQGSLVNWTIEYEKHNENVPDPTLFFDYVVAVSEEVAENLLQQQN